MGCTVKELLSRMSSLELAEWMAFSRLEPFGYDVRVDEQLAMTNCILANSNSKRKFKVDDFMQVRPKPQEQSQPMIKALITGALNMFKSKGKK